MFSKLEIDPIDICNRTCSFCPRSIGYPNTKEKMNLSTAININKKLKDIDYSGIITIAGFGEPLLHKDLEHLIRTIIKDLNIQECKIITNGDYLDKTRAQSLKNAGVTHIKISMYDEDLSNYFSKFLTEFEVEYQKYFNGPDNLVNRNEIYSNFKDHCVERTCYIPFYKMFMDFNGEVFLCSHDWNKSVSGGNINEKNFEEIWIKFNEYRKVLKSGKRSLFPCSACNAHGTLKGKKYFDQFEKKL